MRRILFFLTIALMLAACEPEDPGRQDTFDRKAMLAHWADNIIIPGFVEMQSQSQKLEDATQTFVATPDAANLASLRLAWESAYRQWQKVAMFSLGKAEAIRLRDNLNIYPVDVEELKELVADGTYNFLLPSTVDVQGFPALDYLLYGVGDTDESVLSVYTTDSLATNYLQYLTDVSARINQMITEVRDDWQGDYRNSFVDNDGRNANASVDLMVNDFIFYYEKHLRAGKVGIPAGVFSGSVLPQNVEAYYRRDLSRELLNEALDAVQDFYNGDRKSVV